MSTSISNNTVCLTFAEAYRPTFRENRGRGYIEFGDRNDYPFYLLDLFNLSSKHGAIIRSKAQYIAGNGVTGGNDKFVSTPNSVETLPDIIKKISLDLEIFGGYYLEIIWAINGKQIAEIRHLDYTRVRSNLDNTEFYYKGDWRNHRDVPMTLPAFNPRIKAGRQILYVKEYRPGLLTYALPGYLPCINYIEADIEVSKHVLGNAQTGFSASKLITLPNGDPSDDEKRKVTKAFQDTYTGALGRKFILSFVQNVERKPIVEDLGASDLTKEDFGRVDAQIQQNIYAGHSVSSPAIFGIAEPGKLGNRNEMRDAYEIFKNTYVNAKQTSIEAVLNVILENFGGGEPIKIIPVEPISYEFSEQTLVQVMTKDEIREKMGLPKLVSGGDTIDGQPVAAQDGMVNENVKNLSGRQHQQLLRIIRQFGKGQITKEVATTLLKTSLGLGDNEIATLLSIDNEAQQFSGEDLSVFEEFGEAKENFIVHQSRPVTFSAYDAFYDFRDIQIVEILKKNPLTPAADIAKALKLKPSDISQRLGVLAELGIVELDTEKNGYKVVGAVSDLVKEMDNGNAAKKKATAVDFEIRFSYEWKKVVPQNERNTSEHPSRPFCVKLLQLDRFYTRQQIESISNRLGYDVFTRGGGWWGDSPSCRHEWRSNIVVKKK